jgi:hypothetical protein
MMPPSTMSSVTRFLAGACCLSLAGGGSLPRAAAAEPAAAIAPAPAPATREAAKAEEKGKDFEALSYDVSKAKNKGGKKGYTWMIQYDPDNLPVLLGGHGGRTLQSGQHLQSKGNVPLCNLYVSMLDRMGVEVEQFGDSTKRLLDPVG